MILKDYNYLRFKLIFLIKMNNDIINIFDNIKLDIDNLNGKTILITGGSGFLGTYIVNTLIYINDNYLNEKCKIIIIDNNISSLNNKQSSSNYIKYINANICEKINIENNVDYILHAASIASPRIYTENMLNTIDVGYIGTRNMLELAKTKNVSGFMLFSSSEVYGNPEDKYIPTTEDYNGNVRTTGSRSFYDESKRVAESLCYVYNKLYEIPIKIIRPFNVYGPLMNINDGRGIINLCVNILKNKEAILYNETFTRTHCYVVDCIIQIFKILMLDDPFLILNVGTEGPEINMIDLTNKIIDIASLHDQVNINIVKSDIEAYSNNNDIKRRCPNMEESFKKIKFKSIYSIDQGLQKIINWLKYELNIIGEISNCPISSSAEKHELIDLGMQPLANNLIPQSSNNIPQTYPLKLQYFPESHIMCLSYFVSRNDLFDNYLYISGFSKTFKKHFRDYADSLIEDFKLNKESFVIDIGSNDGILLKYLKNHNINILGIEPAENISKIANDNGINTLCSYLNYNSTQEILQKYGTAYIITANNIFAHITDINGFINNVKLLLNNNGIFIIEIQYFKNTFEDLSFDNIYHEHTFYYSVTSLNYIFNTNNMDIFRVVPVNTHGGSLRVFVKNNTNKNIQVDDSVNIYMNNEKDLLKIENLKSYSIKIENKKLFIKNQMSQLKSNNKKIIGYGAPAKAAVTLNYYELDNTYIDYIIEDNKLKHDHVMPKLNIPIKSINDVDLNKVDYVIILAWNYFDEIVKKLNKIQNRKFKFIRYYPEFEII